MVTIKGWGSLREPLLEYAVYCVGFYNIWEAQQLPCDKLCPLSRAIKHLYTKMHNVLSQIYTQIEPDN